MQQHGMQQHISKMWVAILVTSFQPWLQSGLQSAGLPWGCQVETEVSSDDVPWEDLLLSVSHPLLLIQKPIGGGEDTGACWGLFWEWGFLPAG